MELPNDIDSCHRIILELVSFIDGIKPQLQGYVQKIEQLEIRVKELESQLHQNSRNSNYPSSMDKYKPKPAFPRAKGGKVGGKKGHDGGTLKMVRWATGKALTRKPASTLSKRLKEKPSRSLTLSMMIRRSARG